MSDSYRFLWVALQLDCICEENTDQGIYDALERLPQDLAGTFTYILQQRRAVAKTYQMRILNILLAAYRPLTASQYEQALSVVPGDTTWDPKTLINDIHGVLSCCGGLIVTDEEDGTIRPVHDSFRQFLLGDIPGASEFQLSLEQAHEEMATIMVTYLNYGLFETQLSTRVIPHIDVHRAPSRILNSALGSSPLHATKHAALRLLKSSGKFHPTEVTHILGETSAKIPHHENFHCRARQEYVLLEYAREYWFLHSKFLNTHRSGIFSDLWARILAKVGVDDVIDRLTQLASADDGFLAVSEDVRLHGGSLKVLVAIWHSHGALFSCELRGARGLRWLCGVIPALRAIQRLRPDHPLDRCLTGRLLPIVAIFSADHVLSWLLKHGADPSIQDCCAIRAACSAASSESLQVLAATKHPVVESFFAESGTDLLRTALKENDARSIYNLAKAGAFGSHLDNSNHRLLCDVSSELFRRLRSMASTELQFAWIVSCLLEMGMDVTLAPVSDLYTILAIERFNEIKFASYGRQEDWRRRLASWVISQDKSS